MSEETALIVSRQLAVTVAVAAPPFTTTVTSSVSQID